MKRIFQKTYYLIFFALLLAFNGVRAQQNVIGMTASLANVQQIPLQKLDGKKMFVNLKARRLQIFVFLSPECPLSRNYTIVLNNIYKKFGENIQISGIIPGQAYSAQELQDYVKAYNILFPVMIDSQKEFSNYVKATVTPEVVVTDQSGLQVYRGAIDDWVLDLGKKKLKPEQHYLQQAIEQYLQGQPVTVKHTIPKGCLINEF